MSVRAQIATRVEILIGHAWHELEQEHSELREALAAANVRVEFLERELEQLREASVTNSKPILVAAVGMIGGILLALGAGAAGGAAEGVAGALTEKTIADGQSAGVVESLYRECSDLQLLIDQAPVGPDGQLAEG